MMDVALGTDPAELHGRGELCPAVRVPTLRIGRALLMLAGALEVWVAFSPAQTLFVSNHGNKTIATFDPITGAEIANPLINSVGPAFRITLDLNGNLYVANCSVGSVGKYNSLSGAIINTNLIT